LIAPAAAGEIKKLLIVRLSAMGDVIHTLPAAQTLRDAFPNAQIGWLIEERWAELLCAPGTPRRGPRSAQRPLVDWVHTVNLAEWRHCLFTIATAQQIARVWNDVRSVGYDVAVDLQGAMRSAVLARWSGARAVIGAAEPRESPASLWYTRHVIAKGAHVIEQNLSIAQSLVQKRIEPPRVGFPVDPAAEERISGGLGLRGVGDFALLNPGAGWGAKRWPAERYGEVARQLAKDGLRCLVNFGPGEEDLFNEVSAASGGVVRPTKPSISGLIALTRRAKLFIGGDTGPLHLAAALRVPVVAIFGPTDPARNGPYATRNIVLRNPASATTHARKARPDDGMLEIDVDAVVSAARRLLAQGESGGQECPPHASPPHTPPSTEGAHG
jgi:heptosyltransferase-1